MNSRSRSKRPPGCGWFRSGSRLVVQEVHVPAVRNSPFHWPVRVHRAPGHVQALPQSGAVERVALEEALLVTVEIHVDRVERNDRGELRGARRPSLDQVPSVTIGVLTRPEIGERTRVHSRLSLATVTAASATRTDAPLCAAALTRASCSSRDGLDVHQTLGSLHSRAASAAPVRARSSSASARSRSAW